MQMRAWTWSHLLREDTRGALRSRKWATRYIAQARGPGASLRQAWAFGTRLFNCILQLSANEKKRMSEVAYSSNWGTRPGRGGERRAPLLVPSVIVGGGSLARNWGTPLGAYGDRFHADAKTASNKRETPRFIVVRASRTRVILPRINTPFESILSSAISF